MRYGSLFIIALVVSIGFWGCEGPQGPSGRDAGVQDTQAPRIDWISPVGGDTLFQTDTLRVLATDNGIIDSVVFYVNGMSNYNGQRMTVRNSPYTFAWNLGGVAIGSYTLSARAFDSDRNVGITPSITVVVSNVAPTPYMLPLLSGIDTLVWALPDTDRTNEYAVRVLPVQTVVVDSIQFYVHNAPGDTSYPDLKVCLYNELNSRPGVRMDSVIVPAAEWRNNPGWTSVHMPSNPGWVRNEAKYIGLSTVTPDTVLIGTDTTSFQSHDFYFVPGRDWRAITGSPSLGNLMIRARLRR